MSNFLKSLVLPEVQKVLGLQVIAQKMQVNLLPLYVEATGVKGFDDKGERAFTAESVKAYVGLSGIFRKHFTVETIVVREPHVWLDRVRAGALAKGAGQTGRAEEKPFSLDLKKVVLRDGEVSYHDETLNGLVEAAGFDAEVILRRRPEVVFSVSELRAAFDKWPELKGKVSANFFVEREEIEIKRMNAEVAGSTLSGSGLYSFDRTGTFRLDLNILVDTVKKLKGLEKPGYGSIRARGTLTLTDDIRDPYLDFGVKGDFYLQTLLEALRARTRHELTGLVSFNGNLEGKLSDLKGEAQARLRKANLYTIDVDDLTCKVFYEDRMLRFSEGRAEFYGGRGNVNVSFLLPRAKPYTVDVDFWDLDSSPAFRHIGLAWANLPAGKVKGKFYTSGTDFAPEGWASYEAFGSRDDPLGRIKKLSGKYAMKDKVVTLTEMEAASAKTRLAFGGTLDTGKKLMDFKGDLFTEDLRELTTPHFERLAGSGEFHGSVTGPTSNPVVNGRVLMHDAFLDDYPLGEVEMLASYQRNLLAVEEARAAHGDIEYSGRGSVAFPKALKLFETREPVFDLELGIKKADLGRLLNLHGVKVPIEGKVDGEVTIAGSGVPVYSGTSRISGGNLWGFPVSSVDLDFSYDFNKVRIKNAILRNGESELTADGSITKNGAFDFRAASEELYLKDVAPPEFPFSYKMKFEAQGKGTIERPEINVKALLSSGTFRKWPMGGGTVEAALRGKDLAFDAKVFDEKADVRGSVRLDEEMPWSAELEIEKGRFDFLATTFLKEMPEDMLFSISGRAVMSGTREHLDADVTLRQMTFAMFGQSFTNDEDIRLTVDDRLVTTPGFKLRSGTTSVNVEGSLKYKEYYDMIVYGASSLAPLKALSEKISLLRGNARFVLALQGEWEKPKVNGGIDVTKGAFGIKGVPQRLAEIGGFSYFEDDTVVIEKLDAKLGGGDVEVSGTMKLEGLKARTVNLDMILKEVNLTLGKGLKTNIGGNLVYRGKAQSKFLTGEVVINRAEYTGRIEWKSWLLKVKRAEAKMASKGLIDDVRLSVRLYGEENIVVNNNVANAELELDVVLRGTAGEPLLLGRIEATEGKVYFRNSEFDIAHATADFSDISYTEPYVDIVAETTAKGYQVWLNLEGRPEQLDMTLVSDPHLDEEDILSLLTVGEFGERLEGLEGGIGAAEASSVLAGRFQDVVEERLRDLTGVSRFTVEPYVSRKTGAITPRVTVTKQISGEKIFLTYSSSVSTSEEQEIKLEYIVNRNVSLSGGQDDLGILGGDIKFRFFFK